ncbi:MAG: 3-deoxy-D-manno-octulosonic acid transferase [Gammaproteobacteria bacterium]|nr:3-deoxy-D-manno-octulosonic acid transferase [Gammaproteobacteria bacterium]
MVTILCRWLYSTLFTLALPLVFARLLWRSQRLAAYRQRWHERLGYIVLPAGCRQPIWIHAVSVGEVVAATPIVVALRHDYPDVAIIMTTMTPTGAMQVANSFGDQVQHYYIFYDLPRFIRRFLKRATPRLAIIMETELWPNTLHLLQKRQISVILANARLSKRSQRGYRRFAAMTQTMLQQLTAVAAQSQQDGERYLSIGLPAAKLQITGNTKFDITASTELIAAAKQLRQQLGVSRSIWIAGSTHEGEETQILAAFAQIKALLPQTLLFLVPRHPDRFDQVQSLCQRQGYRIQRRSEQQTCQMETEIFIGDTIGELLLFYAAADVAFVGGSLVDLGGHNMLEPALFGLPVITGPSLFNFADIGRLFIEGQAAVMVDGSDQLAQTVCRFLQHDDHRREYGERGQAIVAAHRGAVTAHMAIIKRFL